MSVVPVDSDDVHKENDKNITSRTKKRRANVFDLDQITSLEILMMEKLTESFHWETVSQLMPILLSVLWIFIGTVFYAVHDDLGWARGLFMSVNAGWSIGWPMEGLSEIDTPLSKLFTIYHTSTGVLFAGVTVLYIAEEVGKSKDNWIKQIIKVKERDEAAEGEGWWEVFLSHVRVHWPSLRIIFVFLIWFSFGLLWYPFTNTEYTVAKNTDFMLSTLTTGGYLGLPSTSDVYQLLVTAIYTSIGVPLLNVSLGLFMSLVIESPEDNYIFQQIVAPVTWEEISFMQEFEIEDGDGTIDCKEFMILAVVRIGTVTPNLIRQINERFRQLDRKRKGKIAYDDLIWGRRQHRIPSFNMVKVESNISRELSDMSSLRFARRTSTSYKDRNRSLFANRAKSVFAATGTPEALEIRANIQRIRYLAEADRTVHTNSTCGQVSSLSHRSTADIYQGFSASSDSDESRDSSDRGGNDNLSNVDDVDENDSIAVVHVEDENAICDIESGLDLTSNFVAPDIEAKSACTEGGDIIKANEENDLHVAQPSTGSDSQNIRFKNLAQKQREMDERLHVLAQTMRDEQQVPLKCKTYEKLQLAKSERRRSKVEALDAKGKRCVTRIVSKLEKCIRSSWAIVFYIWLLWLSAGTAFYCLEEDLTVYEAIYVSTSIGYGIFWHELTSSNTYAKIYTSLHFCIGVLGVAFAMAVFARNLIIKRKQWFHEVKQQRSIRMALTTEELWNDIVALFEYYWPKLYVHFLFVLLMVLGIVWGVASLQLKVLDAWLFSVTAMATGGFVSLPSSGVHAWDYVFYSIFIAVGAPLMAISCGVLAHNISIYGKAAKMMSKINAPMTEDELVMMNHLDLEDDDGYIDRAEFVILVLVRIGALNPDLIGALFERFYEIDADGKGNVAYEALVNRQSFASCMSVVPKSFLHSMAHSLRGHSMVQGQVKDAKEVGEEVAKTSV